MSSKNTPYPISTAACFKITMTAYLTTTVVYRRSHARGCTCYLQY